MNKYEDHAVALLRKMVLDSIKEDFGHRPDEMNGEKWTVYNNNLIIIHPQRRPRIYKQGCGGAYYEFEPHP